MIYEIGNFTNLQFTPLLFCCLKYRQPIYVTLYHSLAQPTSPPHLQHPLRVQPSGVSFLTAGIAIIDIYLGGNSSQPRY